MTVVKENKAFTPTRNPDEQAPPPQELLPLLVPAASTQSILDNMKAFRELKIRVLDEKDYVNIKGSVYAKKSAFVKLSQCFGISTEVLRSDHIEFKDGSIVFLTTMRASAKNGRFVTAVGAASTDRRSNKLSDLPTISSTRAFCRSVGLLVGWTEVSAEELLSGEDTGASLVSPAPHNHLLLAHPTGDDARIEIDSSSRQVERDDAMSARQRSLLVSLINQRIIDEDEREEALAALECFDKRDASDAIKAFLNPA